MEEQPATPNPGGRTSSTAKPFQPPLDILVLAAVDRAERHRPSRRVEDQAGVLLKDLFLHLGLDYVPWTTPKMRPQLDRLIGDGLIHRRRENDYELWALTDVGRRDLRVARREQGLPALPEAPQHRTWRQAREAARERIHGFRDDAAEALRDGLDLLTLDPPAASDAWLEIADRVARACWLVGSASYCLAEWPEPNERMPDIETGHDPSDRDLPDERRALLELLRIGRRNFWSWDQ